MDVRDLLGDNAAAFDPGLSGGFPVGNQSPQAPAGGSPAGPSNVSHGFPMSGDPIPQQGPAPAPQPMPQQGAPLERGFPLQQGMFQPGQVGINSIQFPDQGPMPQVPWAQQVAPLPGYTIGGAPPVAVMPGAQQQPQPPQPQPPQQTQYATPYNQPPAQGQQGQQGQPRSFSQEEVVQLLRQFQAQQAREMPRDSQGRFVSPGGDGQQGQAPQQELPGQMERPAPVRPTLPERPNFEADPLEDSLTRESRMTQYYAALDKYNRDMEAWLGYQTEHQSQLIQERLNQVNQTVEQQQRALSQQQMLLQLQQMGLPHGQPNQAGTIEHFMQWMNNTPLDIRFLHGFYTHLMGQDQQALNDARRQQMNQFNTNAQLNVPPVGIGETMQARTQAPQGVEAQLFADIFAPQNNTGLPF